MATGHALIQRFANRFVNPQLAANQRGRRLARIRLAEF
jgi:hypothetical protein